MKNKYTAINVQHHFYVVDSHLKKLMVVIGLIEDIKLLLEIVVYI